jgi:hypothetical protein
VIFAPILQKSSSFAPEFLTKQNQDNGSILDIAAILTFVYIVYYAVIMAMDTVGDKGKKKKDVEVFAVGNSSQEAFVEEPTFIKEKEALPDTSSAKQETTPSEATVQESSISPEESGEDIASKIMATEDSELYAKAVAAKAEMVKVVAESEDEIAAADYDDKRLALLVAEGDDMAERMSI